MDFEHVIKNRRSIRKFKHVTVPEDDIRQMVRYAIMAPNAKNLQFWKFVAVTSREMNFKIAGILEKKALKFFPDENERNQFLEHVLFFKDAPCAFYVFKSKYSSRTDELIARIEPENVQECLGFADYQSIGAAVENLMLSAVSLGYASCYMCAPLFGAVEIREALELGQEWKLSAVVPVGLPAEFPPQPERRPLDQVLCVIS